MQLKDFGLVCGPRLCACVNPQLEYDFPFDDLFRLICALRDFLFFSPVQQKARHMIDNACMLSLLLAHCFDLNKRR